ncbi:hypothetical protein Aph01nite_16610 [Acrocarpospora phusangensis]|uniref:Uncharacterized protein n=1 Tax=Acrocarpospora phusangensis TaxID=1070424 RepID=A0A919Q711_9ACTN|nr:hypothetical protein [Acrocarpospora phusangensis]GIH23351.1 hypothetical protein Aph01nite_16610 [Acrocarpospora phusangensis]
MYGFIWRRLPGGVALKLGATLVLLGVLTALLWYVVFPWAEPLVPLDRVTVGP